MNPNYLLDYLNLKKEEEEILMILTSLTIVLGGLVLKELWPVLIAADRKFTKAFFAKNIPKKVTTSPPNEQNEDEKASNSVSLVRSELSKSEQAINEESNKVELKENSEIRKSAPFEIIIEEEMKENCIAKVSIDEKLIAFDQIGEEEKIRSEENKKSKESLANWKLGVIKFGTKLDEKGKKVVIRSMTIPNLNAYLLEEIALNIVKIQKLNFLWENIGNVRGFYQQDNKLNIVYDYYEGGSLADKIKTGFKEFKQEKTKEKMRLCIEIVQILEKLHMCKQPVVHGHLTPSNILFDVLGKVFLCDLLFFSLKKYCAMTLGYKMKSKYTAPEYLSAPGNALKNIKPSADIYSLGIIFWEIFHEKEAFLGIPHPNLIKYICDDKQRPKIEDHIPKDLSHLIRCCWQHDEEKRPKISQLAIFLDQYLHTLGS